MSNVHSIYKDGNKDSNKNTEMLAANLFIKAINGNNSDEAHFQTFTDYKNKNNIYDNFVAENLPVEAMHLYASLSNIQAKLQEYNKRGSGIYISINQTNKIGRAKKDIINTRALFIDADGVDFSSITFPQNMQPDIITMRDNEHWHAYWLIDKSIPNLDLWHCAMQTLAAYYGTDTAVVDLARVMRLPSFYNMKDPTNPKLFYIHTLNTNINYGKTPANIIEAHPLDKEQLDALKYFSNKNQFHANTTTLATPDDEKPNQKRASQKINQLEAGIDGVNGNQQLFRAFAICWELGLSIQTAYNTVIRSKWLNSVCIPPWNINDKSDQEILITTLNNVYTRQYASAKFGALNPKSIFMSKLTAPIIELMPEEQTIEVDIATEQDTFEYYKTNILQYSPRSGTPLLSVANLSTIFCKAMKMENLVYLNTISNLIEFSSTAPWSTENMPRTTSMQWTDTDAIFLRKYLGTILKIEISQNMAFDIITAEATAKAKNPAQEYFKSLTWDKIPRIDTFLSTYASTIDNAYTRGVAGIFLKTIVARLFYPGIKADYTPIFEGEQGMGKSTAISIIGGQWYGTAKLDLSRKTDLLMALSRHILVEIPEFSANYKEVEDLKAFLTETHDTYRLPFGRTPIIKARHFSFAITFNPKGNYLKDQTGNRRFFPVNTGLWDIKKLQEDIEQIHAEMYYRVVILKERHFPEFGDEFYELANEQQETRREVDDWADVISAWYHNNLNTMLKDVKVLKTHQIWKLCFNKDPDSLDRGTAMRILSICRNELKLKYSAYRDTDGKLVKGLKVEHKDTSPLDDMEF